ncbi:MAG: hypothetical protein IT317_13730 [Anaerolineales bacterium]|nr:hypothetical protein [Anaerolineales bacterium]
MKRTTEPHPDTPVFLTPLGLEHWRAQRLIAVLHEIGWLALTPITTDSEGAFILARIHGVVVAMLDFAGEEEKAAQLSEALHSATNPGPAL